MPEIGCLFGLISYNPGVQRHMEAKIGYLHFSIYPDVASKFTRVDEISCYTSTKFAFDVPLSAGDLTEYGFVMEHQFGSFIPQKQAILQEMHTFLLHRGFYFASTNKRHHLTSIIRLTFPSTRLFKTGRHYQSIGSPKIAIFLLTMSATSW